jgi:hypothetical protein
MASETDWLTKYPEVEQKSWLDKYPEAEDKPFFDLSDTLSATGRAFTSLGTSVPASMRQAFGGLENPWQRSESYMQSRADMQALQEELNASEAAAMEGGDASSVSSSIREATPSLGFSGSTLVPSLAAGAVTALATKSPAAARSAAAGTSLLMAYRMAGAQFLDDSRERIDNFFQEKLQRPLTPEEQNEAYEELLPLARKFGAAEAGPEALGNMALGGAGKYIRKALGGKNGIMSLASNALSKVTGAKAVGAGIGAAAGEVGTEAITAVEQDRINKEFEQSVLRGEAPESVVLPDRTVQDYTKGITEVAPTTLAMTGLMGLAGLGPTALNRGYRALRPQAEQRAVEAEIVPEEPAPAPPPAPKTPSQVIADTLLTNAVNVSSDATKATEAALAVVQGVAATTPVELPVPTVAPTVETPSPAMEQIKTPSQTITDSAEAGAGVGEAPITEETVLPAQPTTQLENAPLKIPEQESLLQEPQGRVEGRETAEASLSDQLLSPAPSQEEVALFQEKLDSFWQEKPTPQTVWELAESVPEGVWVEDGSGALRSKKSKTRTTRRGTQVIEFETEWFNEETQQWEPLPQGYTQVEKRADGSFASNNSLPTAWTPGSYTEVSSGKRVITKPVVASQATQSKKQEPITPQGTPTPATEGTVMPGGSAMERDVTKPEQMTPEEHLNAWNQLNIDAQKAREKANAAKAKLLPKNPASQIRQMEKNAKLEQEAITLENLRDEFPPTPSFAIENAVKEGKPFSVDLHKASGYAYIPSGYTRQGDLYVFQPGATGEPVQAAPSAAQAVTKPATVKSTELRVGDEVSFKGNTYRVKSKLLDGRVRAEFTNPEGIAKLPAGSVNITTLPRNVNLTRIEKPSPQTTTVATPTETAAPLAKEAAVASVVQQPAEGSIPAVEQESATTAIESNEKADIADAAMAFLEEDLTESKRQWSPEKIAAAKAYFASGGKDMDVLRAAFPKLVGSRPIVQAYLKADKEASEAQAKRDAADAKLAKEIERDEKEQAKAEEAQRKRDELNLKTLNSLIQKTRTNVVQGTVNPTDANQAVAILNRSGEIPNVLFTWIGTSKDFLADPANRVRYPETWAAVSADSKIEGMSENGQPIVFTDNVGVSDLDRKLANLQGTTPEVAAVRRVILHENIHKGMFFLSMKEKMQIFSFLRRMYSPQELDSLAESYSEYADWRTNQISYFSILEEAMTRDFDSMVEIPRDGIWAEFIQFLRGIWQKITGKTSEPTLKDYKDVFRLIRNSLKNSEKVNADMLVNGGGVRMSYAGETSIENLPEERRQFMRDSLDTAKVMAAAGKTSEEIRAVAGWFPGKYDGKMRWEVPDEGAAWSGSLDWQEAGKASAKPSFYGAFSNLRGDDFSIRKLPLSSLLNHPALYEVYPDLKDVAVQTINIKPSQAAWGPAGITIDVDASPGEALSSVLHEVQHWIQSREGFAAGSSPDVSEKRPWESIVSSHEDTTIELSDAWSLRNSIDKGSTLPEAKGAFEAEYGRKPHITSGQLAKAMTKDEINAEMDRLAQSFEKARFLAQRGLLGDAYKQYFNTAGEIEARDVQARQNLTPEQRAATAPYSSENIAKEDAIVMFGGSGTQASVVTYDSPNDAAFNSGAEVARNTDYDERDKEVRSTIRAAYDIAPKTNGPSVPLDELFSIVKQSMPDLTETEFSRILQGLYEDSGALLIEGESPFATFTTEGERAGSAIIMPPTDMTKDDVISMLRGMSAANPAPSGGINQELYDTVLTQLRNFISNGGRIPLPIQLDRSGEANMDNYTGKKAGLGGGLRQGSGVGRAGQTDSGTPLFDGLPEGVQGVIPQAQRVESEVSRNREAIAGRGENREGKAGARPDMGMASGGYTFADYAQIASRIGARVQEVSNDIGGGLAVMADENGATTILINAAQLSERMAGISFGLDINGALETIGNALVEELIHAADFAVQREAWLASGRRKPFTEFATNSDKSMLEDMRKVVASSNDPVKATRILFDAIQASRQLYGAGATPSDIDEIFSSPNGNISIVMSEFVRQMIQQDMHQTVSEASLFRRFIERVMKMLQKIRDAIAPAKAGEFGDILKNRINETEMMLAMAYQQTGARASMIDPEDAATKQFAKNIKDINSGTAKAPFGGVQFKNFMPIDRTVKSAEEYSDAAIKYVNNLEKEGVSLDDIANSVISPAFLESIGIEQDLMAQDALTIEVRQRVDNAAREEKFPGRKKQLSKLSERLSAFWQGVGSKKGQHLGQRRYLVNKARYSWMFIREIAEKAMKEARTNILISNFGGENATSFTQNSYADSDKANQQAVDEVAKDVVNNDEWALIKEGEQVFEGARKTMWERVKFLVAQLAIFARRKSIKASNAKASFTDAQMSELNAILQMSDDEAAKAEAKVLAELDSLMAKLVGDESPTDTPAEKAKRKKRKEIIDTVDKRVKAGESIEPTEETETSEEEVTKAEATAQAILKDLSERYSDPLIFKEKKLNINEMRELYKERVKQGNGASQMTEDSFVNKAIELGADEKTAGILWSAAELEIDAREAMRQDKIRQRNAAAVERADAQAHRIIFAKERLKRQSGFADIDTNQNKDTIIKAFREQVESPVALDAFVQRLIPLKVSRQVAERLFRAAEREKTDLAAMAVFDKTQGPKALQRMINEINNMRRGEEIPLRTPIPWRQLLSQSAKTVEEYRQRIFDAISANEELKNATPEQKARLADLFAEAWESNRTRILDGMLERMIRAEEAKKNLSKEGAKALQAQRMRIVEDINLGIFDNDELAKRMAEKFGIKSEFTETEREKINSLIEVLQDEGLNAVKRQVAAYKLLEVLQGELKIPVAKMLADFWVSSVLSGPNTIVSIGLAVASGAFELSTALSRVFIAGFTNPKQLPSELAGAYKTLARLLSAYGRQANIAWQYLVSGDPVFLDPSMNDVTENMQWGNIGKSNKLAEQMAKSDKILVKSAGLFMRTVSRLLTALDVFNSGLTKEGSLSIVFRQIGLDPAKIAEMEKKSDLKPYKDAIIQKDFSGTAPKSARDKAILDSYALADMMAELDKLGNVSENANFFGQQGAMTLDPSGLGGVGYRAIRSLVTNAEAGADRFLKQAQRGWNDSAQNGDRILSGLELAFAYFMQFAAYNAANFGGVRFARFAGNKFNQGLSFIPGIGFARAFEAEFDPDRIRGKEAFIDSIRRNQIIGVMLFAAGYQILKAIADEPDDEKRGWFINGSWGNLTPEKKQQKLAAGEKEYTIGINGKVFNYANWPISSVLAAIGSLSDLIRFSPDQWNDKNVAQIMASAAMSGAAAAADIPALSQFQELFGNSLSSKDPNEKRMERFAKVMSSYAGGFVPRFLKDIDYAQDPNLRKYETLWEKTASHIPVYRRYEGKEYYDILGQQIQRNVYPGSREFMVKPTDPAYKVLGALNSRGIWLTPANAEHRMVGKGARRRSLTQEEADNYSLETGKGYKQMLLRYGQRALQMPTERARAFLLDKADEVRDRALKKVYRGYQPAT